MARFTKAQIENFDDYESVRKSRLSPKEIAAIDREAKAELDALKAMQESLTREIAMYMAKESIGIVELTKQLSTSTRQTSRIMRGEANVTLATVAEVASHIGKIPRLVFEDKKPKKRRSHG